MTSTLQQEASRKLRLSSQQTMRVAQRLYENGFITYMRTDSTTLSESALTAARAQAVELYGADAIPAEPRRYERQVKNAQEAHEAIRPAGDRFQTPDEVRAPALGRGAQPLRADLEAHGRVADGRRARPDRLGEDRLERGRRPVGRVRDGRHRDHVPRLPARLRGGPRRACDRCRGEAAAAAAGGRVAHGNGARARRPLHLAAGALHRGDASSRRSRSAASAGRRRTRRSWARSSTAAMSASRGRRSCRSSSRSRSSICSSSTSRSSSTTSSPRGWRTTST